MNLIKISLGNGLVLISTKPSPEPMLSNQLTSHERHAASNHWSFNCLLNSICGPTSKSVLVFVRTIHRWLVNSPHKGPVTWKMFLLDDSIMIIWIKDGLVYWCICVTQPQWVNVGVNLGRLKIHQQWFYISQCYLTESDSPNSQLLPHHKSTNWISTNWKPLYLDVFPVSLLISSPELAINNVSEIYSLF